MTLLLCMHYSAMSFVGLKQYSPICQPAGDLAGFMTDLLLIQCTHGYPGSYTIFAKSQCTTHNLVALSTPMRSMLLTRV